MLSRSASVVLYQSDAPRLFLLQLVSRLCMVTHQFQGRLRMNYTLIPKELRPIAEKIEAKARISEDDALALYRSNDLNALGILANVVRERKNGNFATYIHNRYINYSNICVFRVSFAPLPPKNGMPMRSSMPLARSFRLSQKRFRWGLRKCIWSAVCIRP